MKTALYIRVSTEEQAREGYSISAQTQRLKAFCISQNWEVQDIYIDEGISAKDMERPDLQRMLKDIEREEIECVLVYRLDRLTRSVFDLYKMLETFEAHNCKFKSATEVYDTTTAMGRMFITIVAALAQWERENMGERYSMAYAEKARQGKWPLNFAPLGYDLNKETFVLEVNEREAKTVRNIYDLYRFHGMNGVAGELNKRKEYTKEGNLWNNTTVTKILKSPTYKGYIYWRDEIHKGQHEPIIEEEYWEETQKIIAERTAKAPRSVTSDYIFSGKLKCPSCGRPMNGYYVNSTYTSRVTKKTTQTKHYQYRCRKKKEGTCSGSKSISEMRLEKAFLEHLESFDFESYFDEIASIGEKEMKKKVEEINVDDINSRLKKIEKRKKKWQYAWSEDLMNETDFKKRMQEANEEESQLRSLLEQIPEQKEEYNKQEIITNIKEIRENWLALERSEKKILVDSIVDRIHCHHLPGKSAIVIDRVDFKLS